MINSKCLSLCSVLSFCAMFLFTIDYGYCADYYKWLDKNGTMHFADSIGDIPPEYRGQVTERKFEPKQEQSTVRGNIREYVTRDSNNGLRCGKDKFWWKSKYQYATRTMKDYKAEYNKWKSAWEDSRLSGEKNRLYKEMVQVKSLLDIKIQHVKDLDFQAIDCRVPMHWREY